MNQPAPLSSLDPRLAIGGNSPPTDETLLREYLEGAEEKLLARFDALNEALERLPKECGDDETEESFATFGNQLLACEKKMEEARVRHKEPHLNAGRTVDDLFNPKVKSLKALKKNIEALINVWRDKKRVKAAAEAAEAQRLADIETKRRADEAAELERQAAEKRREQEEAERRAQEATDAAVKAEAVNAAAAVKAEADKFTQKAEKKLDSAIKMENRGEKFEALAASGGKASIVRSDSGAASMDVRRWKGVLQDRRLMDAADMQLLLPYFTDDALQKALNGLVADYAAELKIRKDAAPPVIKGAKIWQEISARIK